jgi:hypothetical protein
VLRSEPFTRCDSASEEVFALQRIESAWSSRVLLIVLGLLATIPIWIPEFPTAVDLPQHAAQIRLLHELHDPSFRFASLYEIHWFTPYLIGYMLAYALSFVVSITTACKLVLSLTIAVVPLVTGELLLDVDADPFWGVLTVPGLLGFAYQWGLLNFLVAAPLGLLFFSAVLRHLRRPTGTSFAIIAVLVNLLFFSHILICAFCCVVAVFVIIVRTRDLRTACRLALPLISVAPLAVQWVINSKSHPLAQPSLVNWDLSWFTATDPATMDGRTAGFFARLFGFPRDAFGPATIVLLLAILVLAILAGARLRRERWIYIPIAFCLLVQAFAPSIVFGTALVYQRFAIFLLPLMAVTIRTAELPGTRHWRTAVVVALLCWIGFTVHRAQLFAAESQGYRAMLERMQTGEKTLSLILDRTSPVTGTPVYLNYGAWYTALRGGPEDVSFANYFVQLIQYRTNIIPQAGIAFGWQPEHFRWKNFRHEHYRYFLIRSRTDGSEFFRDAGCAVSLVSRSGEWSLWDASPACYAETSIATPSRSATQ